MTSQQGLVVALAVCLLVAGIWIYRNRGGGSTRAPDLDAEIRFMANDAVSWAANEGVQLDFTPESVERVEGLLALLHVRREREDLSDEQVNAAAARYGAYIGEVIRKIHGGTWAVDHEIAGPGSFPLRWNGHDSFPIGWCGKRIISGEEDNVWHKFQILVSGDLKDAIVISPDG